MNYPRPTTLASVSKLKATWSRSKDSGRSGRASGIDNIGPNQFARRLDERLVRVRERLLSSDFAFLPLRATFISKKGGGHRVICIPTVEDRLIQRLILENLTADDKLRVSNNVSYGFQPGRGVGKAIKTARNLRRQHRWALKSDIESFFNQIQRENLKQQLTKKLRNRSVVPLLLKAIDTEIKPESAKDADRLKACGVKVGLGLRQGIATLTPEKMLFIDMQPEG